MTENKRNIKVTWCVCVMGLIAGPSVYVDMDVKYMMGLMCRLCMHMNRTCG